MSKQDNDAEKEQEVEQNIENEEQVDDSTSEEQEEVTLSPEEELQAKVSELNDKYLRLYSEFENFRKRTAKEKIDLIQSGGENVFKSLLPIIDDFDRAIKANTDSTDIVAINEGVNLIYDKFKNTLSQKGLQEQEAQGEVFDADLHEALTNIPAPEEDLKGKIVEVLEKGYTLNGKVIRFAKVVVGN